MGPAAHIQGKRLADLCHRLAISDESGIDTRKTWARETDNARGQIADAFATVRDGVARGDTLAASLAMAGVFPPLFLEMVDVGEKTGSLASVLHRLSDHYQRRAEMQRALLTGLAWPIMELVAALVIVGLVIGVVAALGVRRLNGDPVDVLGLGVTGLAGVGLYLQLIVGAGLVIVGAVVAAQRGWLWTRPVQRLAIRLPAVGPAIEKICLARLTWALHLCLNVEIDLRRMIPLVLRAAGNDHYGRWTKTITELVAAGMPLNEAFASTEAFPTHFTDALAVAEESGQIVESMARLSKQYEEEAQSAMKTLNAVFGFAILVGILLFVAFIVIRLFQALYVDMLNDALNF